MAEERAQRRLAAILAADVVGYSRLMEQDEAGHVRTAAGAPLRQPGIPAKRRHSAKCSLSAACLKGALASSLSTLEPG